MDAAITETTPAPFRNADEARRYESSLAREVYEGCIDAPKGADHEAYVTTRAEYAAGVRVIRYPVGVNAKGKTTYVWLVHRNIPGETHFLVDRPIADESSRRLRGLAVWSGYGHHVLTARSSKDAHAAAEAIMRQDAADAAERRNAIRNRLGSGNLDTQGFADAEVIAAMIEGGLVG